MRIRNEVCLHRQERCMCIGLGGSFSPARLDYTDNSKLSAFIKLSSLTRHSERHLSSCAHALGLWLVAQLESAMVLQPLLRRVLFDER